MGTKKGMFKWAVWIAIVVGLYNLIYSSIPPLNNSGVMWCSFVALSIYVAGGTKVSEFLNYAVSTVVGILWGVVYLYLIGVVENLGIVPMNVNLMVVVGVVTLVLCAFHTIVTAKWLCNIVPIMFGAVAVTFSQGGTNLAYVAITMVCGLGVALLCAVGQKFIADDGKWKLPGKKNAA